MKYDYTFILPCLNEEQTLKFCIDEIKKSIKKHNLKAEILVSDNGSTDKSVEIDKANGARVVTTNNKGYGNALINGTKNAKGKYCFMGDSDGSYDFYHISQFLQGLEDGYDFVIGNRYAGGIEKKAMPLSHKIGVKFLSGAANLFFRTPIKDYHCGLRAYNRDKILSLKLEQPGMEYASEMIIKAKINNLSMLEVPTKLRKDLRNKKPHLRTIRDGFRHLFLILRLWIKRKKYKINND